MYANNNGIRFCYLFIFQFKPWPCDLGSLDFNFRSDLFCIQSPTFLHIFKSLNSTFTSLDFFARTETQIYLSSLR